ncbi:hypothetical protein B0H16DRAFT_1521099 [Mycena metata]|uniref:F-box domain-containing protein n=1 Tax=Mycena metata TaxID=1033252 RepID=A0AAD7JQ72_9AGAR|nr:hypothetical protein B0H16DRAFT_1540797 [Mycena metata]KAJ7767170.1 hypothetical protein B0H16DRAFT_1521099 [Mycena metata]
MHMLHTNAVPTPLERAWISEHILVQPLKDLAVLDGGIETVRRTFDELKRKRQKLATDIDAHLALLSPVRRLPGDVLREIFVSSLPSTHNAIIADREAPLLLCHVCAGWRSIALTTPRLWSSLHVVVPNQSHLQNVVSLVKQWLVRSGVLPLSLSIAISVAVVDNPEEEVAADSRLLDLLV